MKTFIEHTSMYSACWLLFYVGLGILVYVLDRQYVQKLWTWAVNMGRKEPLKSPKGIVYGQRTGRKFLVATIVSTTQSAGLFFFTTFHHTNPFVELTLWFLEIPAMVVGFAIGYWLWPLWEKRTVGYQIVDTIDSAIEERLAKKASPPHVSSTPTPVAQTAPVVTEPEISPEERIRKYTGK